MNTEKEFERVTEPPFVASKVKKLSREEIEALNVAGAITEPSKIPQAHGCPREVVPLRWGRGSYYGYPGKGGLRWR